MPAPLLMASSAGGKGASGGALTGGKTFEELMNMKADDEELVNNKPIDSVAPAPVRCLPHAPAAVGHAALGLGGDMRCIGLGPDLRCRRVLGGEAEAKWQRWVSCLPLALYAPRPRPKPHVFLACRVGCLEAQSFVRLWSVALEQRCKMLPSAGPQGCAGSCGSGTAAQRQGGRE